VKKNTEFKEPLINANTDNSTEISKYLIESDSFETSLDSLNALRYGYFKYPDKFEKRLPDNALTYFESLDYPYYLLKTFTIDYSCKRKSFNLEDFFIFKKINNYSSCEYIALTDTSYFIEIVGQQCVDMENWISLYVFNKKYKIVDFELLIISSCDSLVYSNRTYYAYRCERIVTTDSHGNEIEKIDSHKVKILKVAQNGKISSRDSLIFRN
jgi:hypothetical protein